MDKIALNASARKLISLYGKGDSWKFIDLLRRLTSGGRAKKVIPTKTPLQLNKFVENRANQAYGRLLNKSQQLPIFSRIYLALAPVQVRQRILDPNRRGNLAYLKRLHKHLNRRGFKPIPGNKMQWRLPQGMKGQSAQVLQARAATAAQGALADQTVGRYSPFTNREGTKFLSYDKLIQPKQHQEYAPSKLQQLIQRAGIENIK